ncbi:MAG: hypothetical protein GF329_20200 [Candidatus Lokiarchaeota archaeon]|nr:hypothetical protein [Candidatus Lokiarchaeota archaeon]
MTQEEPSENNVKKISGWIIWFFIAFINLLIIEALIFAIEPMWGDFNLYLDDFLGTIGFNYVLILVSIIAIPVIYCGGLVVYNLFKIVRSKPIKPNLFHKIISIVVAVFFDFLLLILIVLFGEDAAIVSHLFLDFSIYFYMILTVGLIILIPYIYKKIKTFSVSKGFTKIKGGIIVGIILVGYIFAFLLPFILLPPNVVDEVPKKPKIIAHRGFSHIAPENTEIAWKLALENGSDGIEIDVQISYDGALFLMHDDSLKRTTNVKEKFPNKSNMDSSLFNLSQIEQLDAGTWFVERDPYRAISEGLINQTLINYYNNNVSIPTLIDAVNFCRDNNLILDVDFKYPPKSHPLYSDFFNLTLQTINVSGINQSLVWITSYNKTKLNFVNSTFPEMITALSVDAQDPPTPNEFLELGYDMINTHYGISNKVLKDYHSAGVVINLWTVDIPARFSQLWCLGGDYITTNEQHVFLGLTEPAWHLNTISYYGVWLTIYIFGLSSVLIFIYSSKKAYKKD